MTRPWKVADQITHYTSAGFGARATRATARHTDYRVNVEVLDEDGSVAHMSSCSDLIAYYIEARYGL